MTDRKEAVMSQEKVARNKNEKIKNKNRQKKQKNRNLGWIIAGCIVFEIVAGFCMGKYWLYPKYMGTSETIENTSYDSQDRSGELRDLNDQINSQDEQQ